MLVVYLSVESTTRVRTATLRSRSNNLKIYSSATATVCFRTDWLLRDGHALLVGHPSRMEAGETNVILNYVKVLYKNSRTDSRTRHHRIFYVRDQLVDIQNDGVTVWEKKTPFMFPVFVFSLSECLDSSSCC